jgi:hypothetical protein
MAGKSLPCTRCAAPMELQSGDTLTVVCGSCRLVHQLRDGAAAPVGVAAGYGPRPALKTGMRGKFRDQNVAIIGMTRYRVEHVFWDNYQLIDDAGAVSWLSHDAFRFKLSETPQLPAGDWKAQINRLFQDENESQVVINGVPATVEERGQAELMYLEGELPWPAEPGQLLRYIVTDQYVFEAVGPDADIIVPVQVSHADIRAAFALPWWWRRLDWWSSRPMPLSGDPRKRNLVVTGVVTAGVGLGVLVCAGVLSDDDDVPPLDGEKLVWQHRVEADSTGSAAWRDFAKTEKLSQAWVPPAGGPWLPYAKLPLLNSIDSFGGRVYPVRPVDNLDGISEAIRSVMTPVAGETPAPSGEGDGDKKPPAEGAAAPPPASGAAPAPVDPVAAMRRTAVFVDLPGPQSVAWAMALARDHGHQPVPAVNNVPHQSGLVAHHQTLGAMVYYAGEMQRLRDDKRIPGDGPPAFILERQRLNRVASVGSNQYDNRYYHVEGDFPDAAALKAKGINTVWYVYPTWAASPNWDSDDFNTYLVALDAAGIKVVPVAANCPQPESASPTTHRTTAARTTGSGYRPYVRPVFFHTYIVRSGGGFGGYAGSRVPSSYGSRPSYSGGGGSTFSSGSS